MKFLHTLILVCLCLSVCAQQQQDMRTSFTRNAKPRGVQLPAGVMKNPEQMKQFIKKNTALNTAQPKTHVGTLGGPVCADTSYVKLDSIIANGSYISSVAHTKDDGVLLAGLVYNQYAVPLEWKQYGLLVKTDNAGNILWSKEFTDPKFQTIFGLDLTFVSELASGDIIVAGQLDTSQAATTAGSLLDNTMIARVSAGGNLLWYKTYNSMLAQNDEYMPLDVRSVSEAPNGDLVFCGNTFDNFLLTEFVLRTDNTGNIIWDNNFQYYDDYALGTEGMNAFFENGHVTVVGISFGTGLGQVAVHFLTLDGTSGALLTKRLFMPDYADPQVLFNKSFSHYTNHCIKLANGHYRVYGQPFSDYILATAPFDHFGVLEFDSGFNLVDSYTITDNFASNYYGDNLYYDAGGNGYFMLLNGFYPLTNILLGSIRNRQVSNERHLTETAGGIGGHSSFGPNQQFCTMNDGGFVLAESWFGDNLLAESAIEFRKMHDADTSSVCLGIDTLSVSLQPYHIKEVPAYAYFGKSIPNQVYLTSSPLSYIDTFSYAYTFPCKQKSACDTLKLHGDTLVCSTAHLQIFSVYKNPLCGSFALWDIDTTVVDTMYTVSDTSLAVIFKAVNWQGHLYASLFTGQCTTPLRDSLLIHVVNTVHQVDLGPDTVICPGNNFTFHAGPDFLSYRWQDGSTDSVLIVNQPGTYYVTTTDYCKNNYSDTAVITAGHFPFSIGNDTVKCNADTLTLIATHGFLSYQWTSGYNILVSSTGDTARVFPLTDTSYIASADKGGACLVRDTIHIKVLTSPVIQLGNDTSFCSGQSVILDAGPGFSSYTWTTGEGTEKITVSTPGLFAVSARAANGCMSSDSLRVTGVAPLPQFNLGGADTTICTGQQLQYSFTLPGALYTWSDGTAAGQKTITTSGQWWLSVNKGGCAAADTIQVAFNPAPVVQLGNDTLLCDGSTILLNAFNNGATYLWQDGSTAADFIVSGSGKYRVTASLDGCVTADSVFVYYHSVPHFSLGGNAFVCEGQPLVLHGDIDSAFTFLWQDSSTVSSYTAHAAGTYSLTETNGCGSFTDSVTITTGPCKLHMPSAFSPDHNGDNDLFRVKYPFPVSHFGFLIFNRWGQKVFETTDITKGWDGRLNGQDQPVGAYVWMIYYTDENNQKESAKGTVVLIR